MASKTQWTWNPDGQEALRSQLLTPGGPVLEVDELDAMREALEAAKGGERPVPRVVPAPVDPGLAELAGLEAELGAPGS